MIMTHLESLAKTGFIVDIGSDDLDPLEAVSKCEL